VLTIRVDSSLSFWIDHSASCKGVRPRRSLRCSDWAEGTYLEENAPHPVGELGGWSADAAPFPGSHRKLRLRSRRAAMPAQNWREVYELALLELDTSKLPGRVEAALRAIQQRSLQKKQTLSRKEREEIGDALRALVEVMRRRVA